MATWDELNKNVGAKPVSISSSWDEANEQAKQLAQTNAQTRTEAVSETPQTVAVEPKGYTAKALEAGKSVIKFGLDVVNKISQRNEEASLPMRELLYGKPTITTDPTTGNRTISTDRLDAFNSAQTQEEKDKVLDEARRDVPLLKILNSDKGKATVGFIAENTANIPLKIMASISAIGDQTYEEAYGAWLTERNDPSNPVWQKFLYDAQDSGAQSAVGVLLAFGVGGLTTLATRGNISAGTAAGTTVSSAYYTALSANEQIQETGDVYSVKNIATDVVLDQVLNKFLVGVIGKSGSGSIIKNTLQGFGIEGGTEVAQSLIKYANNYSDARTQEQKNAVLADAKDYVLSGDMLMEFAVGGFTGAIITGAADAISSKPDDDDEKEKGKLNVELGGVDINETRDRYTEFQSSFDPNNQQDVDVLATMSETLNDYAATFNDKTLYVPSETNNAPLLEVETARFPDGKFAVRYNVTTDEGEIGSAYDFTQLFNDQKSATKSAVDAITAEVQARLATTVDEAVRAQLQEVLEYASGRKKTAVKADVVAREEVAGALTTDQLVDLRKNEEIYALAQKSEAGALSEIEGVIGGIYSNLSDVEKAELAADVLDTIRDARFSSIVADLSLKEIIDQSLKVSQRFQTEDQVTAKDFNKITRAEINDVTRFLEMMRTEQTIPTALLNDIKDIAVKYGFRDGLNNTELARLFSLRIGRDERLNAMQSEVLSELDEQVATAKKRSEKREQGKETPNQADVKRLRREIPLLQYVPIQQVESITTPTGRKAFGRFYMNSIQYVRDADVTTLPHESFHAYSNMALTKEEQAEMYAEARRIYGRQYASDLEIEETLAQDFAVWFTNKKVEPQGFSAKLMDFFRKIAEFLTGLTNKRNEKTLIDIFSDVLSEGAAKRVKTAAQQAITPADMQMMRREFFNDPETFTLKMFSNDIFKKDRVGYQEVKQAIKAMNLKKGEASLHELVLDRPEFKDQKKFDALQYISAVKSEMLQIRVVESDTYANYGMDNIRLDYSPSQGEVPVTYILNTNFEHGRTGHFGRDNASGLHSHFRAVMMRDDSAFKVLEIQSDTYQRGLEPITEESIKAEKMDYNMANAIELSDLVYDWVDSYKKGGFSESQDFNYRQAVDTINAIRDSLLKAGESNVPARRTPQNDKFTVEELTAYADEVYNFTIDAKDRYNVSLTPAEKLRLKQSQQFDSMKNLWYEQNIRMAIRKAAEKGAAFVDFADTRTVANIEGYVGDGEGGQADIDSDTEIGDKVTYLGEYDAYVVDKDDDGTARIIYAEKNENLHIYRESDYMDGEREYMEGDGFIDTFSPEVVLEYLSEDFNETQRRAFLMEGLRWRAYGSHKKDQIEMEREIDAMTDDYIEKNFAQIAEEYVMSVVDTVENLDDSNITFNFEQIKQKLVDERMDSESFSDRLWGIYGENGYHTWEDKYGNWWGADAAGDTIYDVNVTWGNNSRDDFDLENMDEGQAGIAAKYGVNDIGGKTKEGEYYKYLKKTRPDLELHEDDNGFTWWRTAITDTDMADVPLYQAKPDQIISGDVVAAEVKQIGTAGGYSYFLDKTIRAENYIVETAKISDLVANDPALAEFIEKGKPRRPRNVAFAGKPVVTSQGEVWDGWSRIAQTLKNGGTTIEIYKGVPKAFYQTEDDQQAGSIYEDLANELERITYQLEVLIDVAGVHTIKTEDGGYFRRSSYPDWIPKDLRDKDLLNKVIEKVLKGETPRGGRQEQAYEVIQNYVLEQLPPELADQFILNQYYAEQYEVADALRAEALSMLQTFVRDLDKKMKSSATLRTKEVKKVIRTNTGQIRTDTKEFSREMRKRARFFNRGYKTGYKQGAKDKLYAMLAKDRVKRDRKGKIETLKRYYKKVKQASRTGSTLPVEYQNRLKDIFEAFDLTTMTAKTKSSLNNTQKWFASQEGDVPKDIAKKLERLERIPVGKLGDDALEQIINEVTRIFENGVTKKRLQDTKDEKEFAAVVERVANSTRDLSRETGRFAGAKKLSYKLYDPTRFADLLDGSNQNYTGANFKELVEPLRISIDKANIRTDAITADTFAEIEQFGEQYSDEEMARMMYVMALEQGADKQAETLAEYYKNEKGYDFVSAPTPKERGAMDAMRRVFKEIRPEVAGAFEQINNTPFPDIDNYFPLRYDREKELFNIKDNAFDFSITKTAQGFTVSRQPSVGRILDINVFKTFANQVSSQIYYAEVQPQLDRTRAIINAPLYQSKLNKETQAYWEQFVEDVATRGRGTGDFIGKQTMDTLRGNISAAIIGYKLSTVTIQPSALFDSMIAIRQELGTTAVLEVIPRFMKMVFSPAALQAASDQSIALKNRAGGTLEIQEMRNATRGIFSDSAWRRGWHTFKSNAYAGIRFADMRVASSVFDTLVKGYEKKGLDRDAAVKRAEQMMMLSQSSANVASRPQILNSAPTRFFLPFQSFVINAFNNLRYDAVTRELKRNGNIKGTIVALTNFQFLAYAVAYEALMYGAISDLFGYDDDEDEQSFIRKMFNSAIGRIPAAGFVVGFDGTVTGNLSINNPALQAIQDNLKALVETVEGDLQVKEAYKAIKGMFILLGIPATQQIHQILTAPDIAGLGSIGMDLGIAYDARKMAEKQRDAVMPLFEDNAQPELTKETLASLAEKVYGSEYTKADVDKKNEKEAAIRRQFAIAKEFGFDDPFVNAVVEKTNNNEVKQAFLDQYDSFTNPNASLARYSRPIRVMGETENLISDALEKELRAIASAPVEDRDRIEALIAEDMTDTERKIIIGDDKQFASLAYRRYGVISEDFYESIK